MEFNSAFKGLNIRRAVTSHSANRVTRGWY